MEIGFRVVEVRVMGLSSELKGGLLCYLFDGYLV